MRIRGKNKMILHNLIIIHILGLKFLLELEGDGPNFWKSQKCDQ